MPTKLKPNLVRTPEEAARLLVGARSSSQIAEVLELPLGQLLHILYEIAVDKRYRSFDIPKKLGGHRTIRAPIGGTQILQNKLKLILEEIYRVKSCVHGFVSGRSTLTNAKEHVRKKYVLNIDISDFFGSINYGRVRGLFMAPPFNMGNKAASVLAHLCVVENQLPQGSPTSPVISNLIAADLDRRLTKLARRYNLRYTRYSDDITFSTGKASFPETIARIDEKNPITGIVEIGSALEHEIHASGFRVNQDKVRLQIRGIRQEVTGLTVNNFPNIRRKYIRRIRAQIHAWKKFGIEAASKEYCKIRGIDIPNDHQADYFKNVLYGELAYLKMIRGETDSIYGRLCIQVAALDPRPPKFIQRVKLMHDEFDIFICHASEDKDDVALPLFDACVKNEINAFLDVNYIKWGDSLTEKINHALGRSRFVVAVLSENSIGKAWPKKEINSALAREIEGKQRILPLIVGNPDMDQLPLLQDKLHVKWSGDADEIAKKLLEMLEA